MPFADGDETAERFEMRWEGPNIIGIRAVTPERRVVYFDRPNSREIRLEPREEADGVVTVKLLDTDKSGPWNVIGVDYMNPLRGARQSLLIHLEGDTIKKYEVGGSVRPLNEGVRTVLLQIRDEMISKAGRIIRTLGINEKIKGFRARYRNAEEAPFEPPGGIEWWRDLVRRV